MLELGLGLQVVRQGLSRRGQQRHDGYVCPVQTRFVQPGVQAALAARAILAKTQRWDTHLPELLRSQRIRQAPLEVRQLVARLASVQAAQPSELHRESFLRLLDRAESI